MTLKACLWVGNARKIEIFANGTSGTDVKLCCTVCKESKNTLDYMRIEWGSTISSCPICGDIKSLAPMHVVLPDQVSYWSDPLTHVLSVTIMDICTLVLHKEANGRRPDIPVHQSNQQPLPRGTKPSMYEGALAVFCNDVKHQKKNGTYFLLNGAVRGLDIKSRLSELQNSWLPTHKTVVE